MQWFTTDLSRELSLLVFWCTSVNLARTFRSTILKKMKAWAAIACPYMRFQKEQSRLRGSFLGHVLSSSVWSSHGPVDQENSERPPMAAHGSRSRCFLVETSECGNTKLIQQDNSWIWTASEVIAHTDLIGSPSGENCKMSRPMEKNV